MIKEVVRIKIRNYRNVYLNHPDPIAFISLAVDTTGHLYDEFIRLLFLVSFNTLTMSHHGIGLDKRVARGIGPVSLPSRFEFVNLKGAVGLIMSKSPLLSLPRTFSSEFF